MRKTRSLALLLVAVGVSAVSCVPFATAQPDAATAPSSAVPVTAPLQIDRLPPAVVPFNDGWLYRPGDDLAWADPASSDDGWQPVALDKQSGDQQNAWHWYRIRINLPAGHPPLALLIIPANTGGLEIYVNGHRAGDAHFQSSLRVSRRSPGIAVPLPNSEGPVLVAIRAHYPDAFAWLWRTNISAALGSDKAVEERIALLHSQAVLGTFPAAAINFALVLAGIALLMLFWTQSSRREYFWLGLYLVLVGASFGLYTAFITGLVPWSVNYFFADPIIYVFSCVQIEFTFAFVHRRVNRFWRMYELLLLACLVCSALYVLNVLQVGVYLLIESIVIMPPAVALPFVLLFWYRRGQSEAGWLILPSLISAACVTIPNIGFIGAPLHLNLPNIAVLFHLWGVAPVLVYDLANGIFLLAIGVVIFIRFTRVSRQQAIAAAEFEAARSVQQVLVPVENPTIPGFRIDGLYLPAGEVGGDFYQVIPTGSGGVLVVVGDVSGKGMPAAMTVSLLVGTFRTLAHYTSSPGEILSAMNQRMLARSHGGFTTCLVLRGDKDGSITIANAGHIAPYLGAKELSIENGLPLGLSAASVYEEAHFHLSASQQLTLMTDGVVEARSASGELFGFERTNALSTQSASDIAHAAQQFGQEDDITVLTLRKAADA